MYHTRYSYIITQLIHYLPTFWWLHKKTNELVKFVENTQLVSQAYSNLIILSVFWNTKPYFTIIGDNVE